MTKLYSVQKHCPVVHPSLFFSEKKEPCTYTSNIWSTLSYIPNTHFNWILQEIFIQKDLYEGFLCQYCLQNFSFLFEVTLKYNLVDAFIC